MPAPKKNKIILTDELKVKLVNYILMPLIILNAIITIISLIK